ELMRVPLIVRFPSGSPMRARAGTRSDVLARGIDVLPTMLQVADLPATGTMWGRSLLDVVEGRDQRDVFLFAQTQTRHGKETPVSVPTGQDGWVEHRQAVFDGRFRLIHDLGTDRTELFDVQADPREMRNLAAEEEYAPELRRLQKQLEAFRRLPAAGESAEDLSPEDIDALRATGYIGADEEGC
ncbi:MAG: DUF4976 domain-containing protein, partial [Planctomycetota bacterium]|nr:DUF4976 domain-containing protein [Planctomycetota bacterium]